MGDRLGIQVAVDIFVRRSYLRTATVVCRIPFDHKRTFVDYVGSKSAFLGTTKTGHLTRVGYKSKIMRLQQMHMHAEFQPIPSRGSVSRISDPYVYVYVVYVDARRTSEIFG